MSHTIDADDILFIDVIDRERRRRRRMVGASPPGAAAQFFPLVANFVNMLHPANLDAGPPPNTDQGITTDRLAGFVNQWTPGATGTNQNNYVTLDVFAAAPDGTNTAQHIAEGNANQVHNLGAGCVLKCGAATGNAISYSDIATKFRLSVFAKAAERTRISLAIADTVNNRTGAFTSQNGTQATFDLSLGVVAVNNSALTGSPSFTPVSQNITSFGGGWYRCDIDTIVGPFYAYGVNANVVIIGYFYLDNGTGNAPASISYAGNGTSGVYAWKANLLPVSALGLTRQVFFDDFLSTSTIDVNNTKAPGYNWYVDTTNQFAAGGAIVGQFHMGTSADYDVANSYINFHVQDSNLANVTGWFMSLVSDGTVSGFIGQAFLPPLMMEARFHLDPTPGSYGGAAQPIWWTDGAEGIFDSGAGSTWPVTPIVEPDWAEWGVGTPPASVPSIAIHQWNVPPPSYPSNEAAGKLIGTPYPINRGTPNFTVDHVFSNLMLPQATGTPPFGSGQRNIMPNTSWAGGVVGSPGTLPTRMQFITNGAAGLPSGLSSQVVAVGGGLFQLRIFGTVGAGSFTTTFEMNSGPHNSSGGTIAPGQVWTGSLSLHVVAGSENVFLGSNLGIKQYNSADTDLGGPSTGAGASVSIDLNEATLTRYSCTLAVTASNVARLGLAMLWGFATGEVVDVTYEFSQPQLELGIFPSPFQAATGSDVTGTIGTSVIQGEPFFKRYFWFFDGGHCYDNAHSSWSRLRASSPNFIIGDSLHYPPILSATSHVWPMHWDYVRIITS